MYIHDFWLSGTKTIPRQTAKTSHKSDYNISFQTEELTIHFVVSMRSPQVVTEEKTRPNKTHFKNSKISQIKQNTRQPQTHQIPSTQKHQPQAPAAARTVHIRTNPRIKIGDRHKPPNPRGFPKINNLHSLPFLLPKLKNNSIKNIMSFL